MCLRGGRRVALDRVTLPRCLPLDVNGEEAREANPSCHYPVQAAARTESYPLSYPRDFGIALGLPQVGCSPIYLGPRKCRADCAACLPVKTGRWNLLLEPRTGLQIEVWFCRCPTWDVAEMRLVDCYQGFSRGFRHL